MYFTYIIFSDSLKKYYTGHTNDLTRRLQDHNRGKNSFSAKGIPWIIVFSSEFNSRNEAMKFEMKIKKRGAKRFLDEFDPHVGQRMAPLAPGPPCTRMQQSGY